MLSIGKLSPDREDYYLDMARGNGDDYYLDRGEPAGRWVGSAAEDAGLVVWHGHSPRDPRAYWTLPIE